jgi:hypothetical protein
MTNQCHNTRAFPNLHNMTSTVVGDAMRERAIALKSKLTPDQAQAAGILVDMAG